MSFPESRNPEIQKSRIPLEFITESYEVFIILCCHNFIIDRDGSIALQQMPTCASRNKFTSKSSYTTQRVSALHPQSQHYESSRVNAICLHR